VLVTHGGRVKLVDFGIAKTTIQLARTRTGILRAVAYMSPEQALGESLDRRSDVFCIGILLWEMTTRALAVPAASPSSETLKAVVEQRCAAAVAGDRGLPQGARADRDEDAGAQARGPLGRPPASSARRSARSPSSAGSICGRPRSPR
jgi:serine/threonine protein kinase